jgi:hypothetical protein
VNSGNKPVPIFQRAVLGVYILVVGAELHLVISQCESSAYSHVVPHVCHRAGVYRPKPYNVGAQVTYVVQLGEYAIEVSNAVAVRVEER